MDDAASSLAELEEDDVGADRSDESDGVARAVPRDVRGSKEVDLADADGGAVDVEDPVVRQAVEVVDGGAVVAIVLGRGVVRDVADVPVAVRVEGVRVEGIVQRVRARGGAEAARVIAEVVPFVVGLGRAGGQGLHGLPRTAPTVGREREMTIGRGTSRVKKGAGKTGWATPSSGWSAPFCSKLDKTYTLEDQ